MIHCIANSQLPKNPSFLWDLAIIAGDRAVRSVMHVGGFPLIIDVRCVTYARLESDERSRLDTTDLLLHSIYSIWVTPT